MIRVLLVDDHRSLRQSLAYILARQPGIVVGGEAGSLAEARRLLAEDLLAGIDVALIDLNLPDGPGLDLIHDIRAARPTCAIAVLTASDDRLELAQTVEAGAAGALHKSVGAREIINAVRRLSVGELLLSSAEIMEMLRLLRQQRQQERDAEATLARLTPREREVLQSLADGLSDKDMAQRLHISAKTARAHVVSILAKLGVNSRLQALVFAVRHDAVTIR